MIASTRDREVKLHWTVHGQLILMLKSDTRDKSEKARKCCLSLDLHVFNDVVQLFRLSNFNFWDEL